jgi:signal transduction histidine kinase/ActR/RegA family two-component response regulator
MQYRVGAVRTWHRDGTLAGLGGDAEVDLDAVCADTPELVKRALAGQSSVVDAGAFRCEFGPLRRPGGEVIGAMAVVAERPSARARHFEDLITDLSTKFVSVNPAALDQALNEALRLIGEFAQVDRVYLFRFTADGSAMDNTHEWCAPGIEPQIQSLQGLPLAVFPWGSRRLRNREVIHVPDVRSMPPEAAVEREMLVDQGVKSMLGIPMIGHDQVVGFVGYDSVKETKHWPGTEIALLRIAGEIFTGALERARADTERRQLETQLVQARSLENVARLAGGVAHDFNNLIAVILNYTALLQREITLPDQRAKLDELFGAAQRAGELTRQLLLIGRRDIVAPMFLDLSDVITSLEALLQQTVGDSVELCVELGSDLGTVRVGLPQIEQVILNLTLNARDAMPHGGRLRIKTENAELTPDYAMRYIDVRAGQYARISVSDDGVGMTPEVLARAFEPFFTTKGRFGTGLGLSSVHGIVKQAGGHVAISTELGSGTTVDVYLPVVVSQHEAEPLPSPAPATTALGRGETVLVVDDSASLRRLVRAMLSANGYRPLEAATPEEAIAAFASNDRIDLLLTDVIMPQMSGRALAERAREDYGITCVLYMSGYSDDIIAPTGVLEPGTYFLPKPFLEPDLLRAVRRALDANEARAVNA